MYWLAGATGCGVLFAIVATFSLGALEYAVYQLITLRNAAKSNDATTGEEPPARDQPELEIELVSPGNVLYFYNFRISQGQ